MAKAKKEAGKVFLRRNPKPRPGSNSKPKGMKSGTFGRHHK